MTEYRTGAHAVYDIKYHLIWITKYRYRVLLGRVAERAGDLIDSVAKILKALEASAVTQKRPMMVT